MTCLFEGIDFFERRFDRADVRAITGLTDKKLDNWSDRRLIPAEDQRPGKGGRRRYHGFEVFALQLMGTLTDRFRIPPGDAVGLAKIVTKEIIEWSTGGPDLMVPRVGLMVPRVGKKGEIGKDLAYVLLWHADGHWRMVSDYTDPTAPLTMEMHRLARAYISLPVTAMFLGLVGEVCEREDLHGVCGPGQRKGAASDHESSPLGLEVPMRGFLEISSGRQGVCDCR